MTVLLCLLAAWSLEVSAGSAVSLPTRLVIHQQGQTDLDFTAQYRTRPFSEVPYYDVRLGRSDCRGAWELELVHHKLYLANRPPEVDTFEITHGYNFITANRSFLVRGFDLRAGAGVVMPHPQTTIRGRHFDATKGMLGTGWYFSGGVVQVGLGHRFALGRHWQVGAEAKGTAALARVPIVDGWADVPNLAIHGLITVGYLF